MSVIISYCVHDKSPLVLMSCTGNFGTVFVDQSYWQSSVAAKPKEGMWGFLFGGVVWFAVPFAFATTMGLAYIALSTYWGHELLSDTQIGQGIVEYLYKLVLEKVGK